MTRPVRKFPSSPELELPRPKLVPLRLDQVIPYTTDPEFEWVRNPPPPSNVVSDVGAGGSFVAGSMSAARGEP